MISGEPSQSSFHLVGLTAPASSDHNSVGSGRSKATTCSLLSRLPE